MKKKNTQWTALLLALVLMFSLTACGSSSSKTSYDSAAGSYVENGYYPAEAEEAAYDGGDYGYYDEDVVVSEAKNSSAMTTSEAAQATDKKDVKIIYTANLNVEALDLDAAIDSLNKLVNEMGGYFQTSDRSSYGRSRQASYTVRVPSNKYRAFLDAWSDNENCKLTSVHEDTEDVGVKYFDLETHLTTLRNKMNRLQALLEQATEMEDIIQLESAISDTEYQIELYTSDLNRYDSLINYSTVNISISEVIQLVEEEEVSFLQRLGQNLRWGLRDFGDGVEELVIWLAYNLLSIIVTIIIVVVFIKLFRRHKAKKAALGEKPRYQWKGRKKAETPEINAPAEPENKDQP